MCILQQGEFFMEGDFDALTGAKFSQWGRIFRANISPGAKYTQQGGDKYMGAILIGCKLLYNFLPLNILL